VPIEDGEMVTSERWKWVHIHGCCRKKESVHGPLSVSNNRRADAAAVAKWE
jgi:hypothetical protein